MIERATADETRTAWEALLDSGAYLEGHFFLPSTGKHYDKFFQIPLALQHSNHARTLCISLARILRRSGILHRVEKGERFTLIAPVDGGIPVAYFVGDNLNADRILWVSDKSGRWELRPLITIDKNDVVIIVDDIIFTGRSISSLLEFLKSKGPQIIAIATIVDRRRGVSEEFEGIPVYSVLKVDSVSYEPANCPLCKDSEKMLEFKLK